MNLDKIKTGDIFFYKGTRFVSKAICLGMLIYGKIIGRYKDSLIKLIDDLIVMKYIPEWIPSHTGTFIWRYYEDGSRELYIAESVDNGFKIQKFSQVYNIDKDDFLIKTPVIEYSSEEIKRGIFQMEELLRKSLVYNYISITFSWIVRILSWNTIILFSDREDITACYESTTIIGKAFRECNFINVRRNSTADAFQLLDNYNFIRKQC